MHGDVFIASTGVSGSGGMGVGDISIRVAFGCDTWIHEKSFVVCLGTHRPRAVVVVGVETRGNWLVKRGRGCNWLLAAGEGFKSGMVARSWSLFLGTVRVVGD